jgi:hypothetical protein
VGDLALRNGIIVVYGRDDVNGQLSSPARVVLSVFPFAGLSETGTPGAVDYVSAANVTGCEKCHTVPYLKHGYIYGRVGGVAATDFYTCKGCHMDNARPGDEPEGGHFIWQLLVDNPTTYLADAGGRRNRLTDARNSSTHINQVMNDA